MPLFLNSKRWKTTFLISAGGGIEYYDFAIFAIFAVSIGQSFFPSESQAVSLISAFAVFASGYLARPIGGFIFSHLGDRYGRKKSFSLSISIMAISTLLMAFVPTHAQIGISATLIFLCLRIIQGIALGGEIPGAITYVVETVRSRPSLATGIVFAFFSIGIIFANGTNAILIEIIPITYFHSVAWRIAFIFGSVLGIAIFILRRKLEETPSFLSQENRIEKLPLFALLREHPRNVLAGTLIVASIASITSMLFLFMVTYLKLIPNYSLKNIAFFTIIPLMILPFSCTFWGFICDYLPRKKVFGLILLLNILTAYWLYNSLISHNAALLPYFIMVFYTSIMAGLYPVVLAQMFPTHVRFSGTATCYNISYAIFGGLSPMIATYFIESHGDYLAPAWIIIITCLLSLLGLAIAKSPQHENHL
jgi:MFS family permease